MKAFFLLLGLLLGLGIGKWEDVPFCVCLIVFAILICFLCRGKKAVRHYLCGLGIGLCFGLVSFLPLGGSAPFYVVTGRGNGYVFVRSLFKSYYLIDKQGNYEIGDILKIEGSIVPYKANTYESRFSFVAYLSSYGIKEEISGKVSYLVKMPLRPFSYESAFLSRFDGGVASVLGKLLFGRSLDGSEVLQMASALQILYVLSSGGLLFGALLRGLERLLSLFLSKEKSSFVVAIVAALFLPLGLRKIGILRVILTRNLKVILGKRGFSALSITSIAAILMLEINPYFAFQSAYLLGFGLSFSFLFVGPLMDEMTKRKKAALGFGLLHLFLLPLHIASSRLAILSPFIAMVLLPIATLTMGIGYLSFLIAPFPHVLGGLVSVIEAIVTFASKISFLLWIPSLSSVGMAIFYAGYGLAIYFHEISFRRLRNGVMVGLPCLYLLSLVPFGYAFTSEVAFINVGQGDSILLRDHDKVVLMDTGGNRGFDMATESLIPFFLKRRIYHIDAIIESHGDFDHVGAESSLMKNFRVKKVLREPSDFPYRIGRMKFENFNHYPSSDENGKSLVLKVTITGRTFLLTGDAPKEVERKIIQDHPDLRCDILKVGHHGSNTSTGGAFLDLLKPKEAIISCGGKNSYGHPHAEVLNELRKRGIAIRRTDEEGTILYQGYG